MRAFISSLTAAGLSRVAVSVVTVTVSPAPVAMRAFASQYWRRK
jgi:hypothetical protein